MRFPIGLSLFVVALFSLSEIGQSSAQVATGLNASCHVLGAAMPATLTIPTCDEGGNHSLATSAVVATITVSNTDTASHTFTIEDCQMSPFLLANGTTIAANTVYTYPLGGIRFGGCVKWSASSTTVQAALSTQ